MSRQNNNNNKDLATTVGSIGVIPHSHSPNKPTRPASPPKARVSKLELEVQRLEAAGTLLVQRPGEEVAGLILLEKAIFSRARFPILASEIWRRAEQLIVLCCQLIFRLTQQTDSTALVRCKEIVRIAERVLQPPPPAVNAMTAVADPFDGFDALKRSLAASIRIAYAVVLTNIGDASPETVLAVIESGLMAEQPRPSPPTLYNLAVAYVNAGRFDEAAACVVRCIDLVSHYTTMHLNLTRETEPPYRCFVQESATYTILAHHLVASIGTWCNLPQLTLQHGILALRCAERCLGTQHALTTRCAQFVRSLELQRMSLAPASFNNLLSGSVLNVVMDSGVRRSTHDLFASSLRDVRKGSKDGAGGAGSFGGPPRIPFQMQSFSAEFLPSLLLPFTLVQSHPIAFDLPAASLQSRVVAPLLLTRDTSGAIDATTARRMTNEALRKAKIAAAVTGTSPAAVIPTPPSTSTLKTHLQRGGVAPLRSVSTTVKRKASPKKLHHPQHHHHHRDESQQQQQQEEQIMPVHDASPKYLSVIPLRDYDLYRQIQQEVGDLVSSTEHFVTAEMNRRRHNQVSLLRLPAVEDGAVMNRYSASVQALREISYLRPDHTLEDEALWNIAAFKLQKFMRRVVARSIVEQKRACVTQLIRRHIAADTIFESWQLYKLRRASKKRLHFLRHKRSELDCILMLQSSLRFHQAIERYAECYVQHLRYQIWERQHWKKRQLGATMIQSIWRSHASRTRTKHIIASAVKLQRFRRKYVLYLHTRLAVFRRRQRRRAFYHRLHSSAGRLQRWFLREIVRVHALRELRRQQRLRDAIQSTRLEVEWVRYQPFRDADHRQCGRRILRFLRMVIWRRNDNERHRRAVLRHAAATIVRRAFLRFQCRKLRRMHAEQQARTLTVMRRKEEVREAVYDLQRFCRGFMGRSKIYAFLKQQAREEAAARRIQRFALLLHARVQRRELEQRREFETSRYQSAALRSVSALMIQCAWRRFLAKRFVQGYSTFLHKGRNTFVTQIQRAYRRHRARNKYRRLVHLRMQRCEEQRIGQLRECAASRIQRAFRSALQRRLGRRFAVATVCDLARLRRAATMIQRRWRYTLSRLMRFDMARRRDEQVSLLRAEEHRVAAVIRLQRWARGATFLARNARAAALPGLQHRSALRIQCMVRCHVARKQLHALQLLRDELVYQETVVKDQRNAAILIQRNVRMWLARRKYQAEKAAASVIQTMWHAIFVRRHLRTERIMSDYEKFLHQEEEEL